MDWHWAMPSSSCTQGVGCDVSFWCCPGMTWALLRQVEGECVSLPTLVGGVCTFSSPHFFFFFGELGRCIFSEIDSGLKWDFCQSTSASSFERASVALSVKERRGWARSVPEAPGCLRDAVGIPWMLNKNWCLKKYQMVMKICSLTFEFLLLTLGSRLNVDLLVQSQVRATPAFSSSEEYSEIRKQTAKSWSRL